MAIRLSRKATMQDIADKLGITKVSVSKAINGQPGISGSLREQIRTVAGQMGYIKSRHNTGKPVYAFALVYPKRLFLKDESFYTTIYYYINKSCLEQGYSISCFVVNDREELSETVPVLLQTGRFDGIFITGEFNLNFLHKLENLGGVKIAIDFYHTGLGMDSIVTDSFYASLQITDYLIRKGHRKIGFLGDIHDTTTTCDRYFGYLKGLLLNHLPVREDWHLINPDAIHDLYSTDFELPAERPTAFVSYSDKAAFKLIQCLTACGIKVPEQVSVISFDNTSICDLVSPKLTSVSIDRKQIALHSLDRMINRIQHPDAILQKTDLGSSLIERDSVADLRP